MSQSILELGVQRAGVFRGAQAASIVVSWSVAVQDLGHELGHEVEGYGHTTAAVREYAAYWKMSERSAWNDLRRFKAVFGEESPARLASELARQCDVKRAEKNALLTAPLQFA